MCDGECRTHLPGITILDIHHFVILSFTRHETLAEAMGSAVEIMTCPYISAAINVLLCILGSIRPILPQPLRALDLAHA